MEGKLLCLLFYQKWSIYMYKEMYVFESSCLVGFCISLNQEPTQVTHMKGAFHIWSKTRLRFKLI